MFNFGQPTQLQKLGLNVKRSRPHYHECVTMDLPAEVKVHACERGFMLCHCCISFISLAHSHICIEICYSLLLSWSYRNNPVIHFFLPHSFSHRCFSASPLNVQWLSHPFFLSVLSVSFSSYLSEFKTENWSETFPSEVRSHSRVYMRAAACCCRSFTVYRAFAVSSCVCMRFLWMLEFAPKPNTLSESCPRALPAAFRIVTVVQMQWTNLPT